MNVLDANKLPAKNLVSCLMDSCNVMRGSKNGVEQKLRGSAPQLLDVDGDSCHHIHNATKRFCSVFDYHCEGLFKDLHSDFKWCPDLRNALQEMCELLSIKFTMPEQ